MLKVNVGFNRKVSRDFNSTGFSVNLEDEVCAPLDDPEMVIEKIKELYDLAEESLNQQVERYESESAIASHDEAPPRQPVRHSRRPSTGNGRNGSGSRSPSPRNGSGNGNGHGRGANGGDFAPATNKQVQYLLSLGKRQGLTTPQLRQRVVEIVGRDVDLYDLSKGEAGIVLDELTAENAAPTSRRR